MKKLLFPALFLLAACGSNEPKQIPATNPSDATAVQQVDNSPQAFFGSPSNAADPSVEIISNADGSFLVKYRVDGTVGESSMQKEPLVVNGKPNVGSGEVKLKGSEARVSISPGKCSGGTHVCKLTIGENTTEICGSYAE